MQIDFDARLAASTVLVDGREWCQGTLTNLATNPSFEAAGSTVEVRRNLATVPRAASSRSWGSVGALSGFTVNAPFTPLDAHCPTTCAQAVTTATTGERAITSSLAGENLVSAGSTYTISFYWRCSETASVGYRFAFIDAAGAVMGSLEYGGNQVGTSGRVSITRTAPAGAVRVSIGSQMNAAVITPAGAVLQTTGVLIEQGPYLGNYFDGSYSPDPDLTPSWAGTADASASALSGARPAQVVAPVEWQGRSYQTGDSPVTGGQAQRFLCLTTSSASIPCMQTGSVTTGALYTMVMWVRASRAITVRPRIKGATSGVDAATLEPGVWTLVRTTVTAGAGMDTQTGLLLDGTSGHQIGDTVDVDDFTIVEGERPDLMPFHGSTVNPDWPGVTYAWTGTPNASTSTRTTPTIDRIEVDRDPGTGWVPVRGGRRDVINGFVALTDHEMPLHQEVRYRVAGYSGDTYVGAFTGTVDTTIPGWCGVFVKIPANPNATVMVDPTNSIDIDSSTQGGSYDIAAGSSIAVAAWSGVNASRFTLNAITKADVDSAQMRALLQKNRVILLQGPDWEPFPPGWYYVESVSEGLRGDGAIKQGRKWSLSLVSTGIPSGDTAGVAGASWNQIRAKYATWDELKTANETWFDVLQGGN